MPSERKPMPLGRDLGSMASLPASVRRLSWIEKMERVPSVRLAMRARVPSGETRMVVAPAPAVRDWTILGVLPSSMTLSRSSGPMPNGAPGCSLVAPVVMAQLSSGATQRAVGRADDAGGGVDGSDDFGGAGEVDDGQGIGPCRWLRPDCRRRGRCGRRWPTGRFRRLRARRGPALRPRRVRGGDASSRDPPVIIVDRSMREGSGGRYDPICRSGGSRSFRSAGRRWWRG